MSTIRLFEDQVNRLASAAADTFDMAAIEPQLGQLLSTMEQAGDAKSEIIDRLKGLSSRTDEYPRLGRPGLLELLEYTMHKLRWPEIHEMLLSIDGPSSYIHERELARRILETYSDKWSNADIYQRYRVP